MILQRESLGPAVCLAPLLAISSVSIWFPYTNTLNSAAVQLLKAN